MTDWYIGIDGGGTQTRAVVLDESGSELARVEGPAALADPRDPEAAAAPIAEVARIAAEQAGRRLPSTALWAAIAGVGRETVRASVQKAVERERLAQCAGVGTDVEAAFHDAFRQGPGILVVSGTGSVAWGRNESGREARVGGWGSLIGDEGSGYAIGLEALRRVARGAEGRGPETGMERAVLTHLGLDSPEALVSWTADATKADIAALVPLVVAASKDGDGVAVEILVKAVEELDGHVHALLSNLGPWSSPPRVAFTGGLLGPKGPLRRSLEVQVAAQRLKMVDRDPDPALGAAMLAQSMSLTAGT
jgi:N-acetylglucosamine kinase-like BadF-type ATPase